MRSLRVSSTPVARIVLLLTSFPFLASTFLVARATAAADRLDPPSIGIRPSEERLPEPALPDDAVAPAVLPPVPPTSDPSGGGAQEPGEARSSAPTTLIDAVVFDGNTVVDDETLERIAAPFLGRALGVSELESLRDALTMVYVERGYATSGAELPAQMIERGGTLRVEIVEGRLAAVQVSGNEKIRDVYVSGRVRALRAGPLHLPSLEARLRRLRRDPRFRAIHATLRPAARSGESILDVRVLEAPAYTVFADVNNRLAPSLGEVRGGVGFQHLNLYGMSDRFVAQVDLSEGGTSIDATYEIPFNRFDTRVWLNGRYSKFDLVNGIGEDLDIESRFWGAEVGLRQPFHPTTGLELDVSLSSTLRETDLRFLFGSQPFPIAGAPDGKARVAALRLGTEAIFRSSNQVIALRSGASLGVHLFGSTRNSGPTPDSRFVSWLLRAQWIRRLDPWSIELVGRGDLQLANRRLLSLEQFSLGGGGSVRGYRQNQLVRDEGVVGSFEIRVPIWRSPLGDRTWLQGVTFVDAGRGFSRHADAEPAESLVAVGVGARFALTEFGHGEIYYAKALRDFDQDGDSALQDRGLHFRFTASWP